MRPDCRGTLTSLGHNLIGDDTGCGFAPVTGDLVNSVPLLGLLRDNGGPTFTHALLPGSPAIDAGDDARCPSTDQRGVPRPQGAACDIGAYERGPSDNTAPVADDQAVTTEESTEVTITLTGSDADTGDAMSFIISSLPGSGDLVEGTTNILTAPHTLTRDTVTYNPDPGFSGTDSFTFKVDDGKADSLAATVTITVKRRPLVRGTVRLEGMPNPITGARITFSGDSTVRRVTSSPEDGGFEVRLPSGTYDIAVEKDGFLPAAATGVVVSGDVALLEVTLLWGDANGDRQIDIRDLVLPAKNLGKAGSAWTTLPPPPPVNEPPTAEAGDDQTVPEGSTVTLDGTASFDPEGDPLTFIWTQVGGPEVDLIGTDTPTPSFVAIDNAVITFQLQVNDGTADSVLDTVEVTVVDVAPTVDAGQDTEVTLGGPLTLTATFTDPGAEDTHTAIIDWGDESEVTSIDPAAGSISAEHIYATSGDFTVTVTVTDDDGDGGTGTMTVTVVPS